MMPRPDPAPDPPPRGDFTDNVVDLKRARRRILFERGLAGDVEACIRWL